MLLHSLKPSQKLGALEWFEACHRSQVCVHVCACLRVCLCVHVCVGLCEHVCVYACMFV